MRVGYDEQVLLAQTRGGISRYVVHLIRTFRQQPELRIDPVLGWRWTPNAHAAEAELSRPIGLFDGGGKLAAAEQGGYYLANTRYRRAARRAEVLHHTYSHPRFLAPGFRGPRVSTVYDMTPEIYPDLFPNGNPHLSKRDYVAQSDLICCISESTRRDLINIYGDPGVPMPVTYLGVDPQFVPGGARPSGLPDRYVLFLGRRDAYKDFAVLVDAFAGLPDDGTALVVVGGGPFTDIEARHLTTLEVDNRTIRLDASDAELPRLYAHALVFVFPSRYEGFGLPTLEAMACGVPVVLPDTSSHPEVGGEVARYFPAGDCEALRAVLAELLDDDGQRAERGKWGVARAATFSWDRTAQATAAAYHQLTGSSGSREQAQR